MRFENLPGQTQEKVAEENGPEFSVYLKALDQRILDAKVQLERENSKEWTVNSSGFPIQPKGVEKAVKLLDHLEKIRSMFTFVDSSSPLSLEDALARVEKDTKRSQNHYEMFFGKKDPKDVDEEKRGKAMKLYEEIRERDAMVSEFLSMGQ